MVRAAIVPVNLVENYVRICCYIQLNKSKYTNCIERLGGVYNGNEEFDYRGCIGLIFMSYGIVSLFLYRKKQENRAKENFVLALVCILVGIFLVGHVVFKIM